MTLSVTQLMAAQGLLELSSSGDIVLKCHGNWTISETAPQKCEDPHQHNEVDDPLAQINQGCMHLT